MAKVKNREWWIEFIGDPKKDSIGCNRYVTGERFEAIDPGHEVIHVREVNPALDDAYAECERVLEESKEHIRSCFGTDNRPGSDSAELVATCDSVLNALKKARE